MDQHLPFVSVVIPAYNAETTIGPLLNSLSHLNYPHYEVIVVDDGSRDRTGAIADGSPFRVIHQPNRGASAARDAGLRAAEGDVVAYVDSDVSVTPDWLVNLVKPFSDPTVGATTGQTVFLRNEKCASWMRSMDIERRNAHRRPFTRLANGPNCAFRKEVLLGVGGFNPAWYHAEDTEVSYRVWQAGYRIRYVPSAIVHHIPEEEWRNYLRKRYRDAKAFTRMLVRYPRHAIINDDYVTLNMKVQPPLFLVVIALGVLVPIMLLTAWATIPALAFGFLVLLLVLVNVPEAVAVTRASRRPVFFFEVMALALLRGFAWGVGLGVGGVHQLRAG